LKLIKKIGIFNSDGAIILHPNISISWKLLSNKNSPELPPGTPVNIDISLDETTLLSGKYGIVWATFSQHQAEVLSNALLAQNITSIIGKVELEEHTLLLIKISNQSEIIEAMDFIWRKESGLRLKPDWSYAEGVSNKSFERWVNG